MDQDQLQAFTETFYENVSNVFADAARAIDERDVALATNYEQTPQDNLVGAAPAHRSIIDVAAAAMHSR